MTDPNGREPPGSVWYTLEEALDLLAALEDARAALTDSGHQTVVLTLEPQVRDLSRTLGFDDQGDADDV
jgi:hypothetical protein